MPKILKTNIGQDSEEEIYDFVDRILDGQAEKKYVVTLNPEILLFAKENEKYREIVNGADLRVVDGFGIRLVSFFKGMKVGERVTGADLAEHVLKESIKKNLKIGLVVRKDGLSSGREVRETLKKYETVEVVECDVEKNYNLSARGELPNSNLNSDIEILLVGLGAPYQEIFIEKYKKELSELKLAMGVGGTFDFWTGKRKRAPKFLRKIGLEWLWRGLIQPNRFFRVLNSTIVFFGLALIDKDNK